MPVILRKSTRTSTSFCPAINKFLGGTICRLCIFGTQSPESFDDRKETGDMPGYSCGYMDWWSIVTERNSMTVNAAACVDHETAALCAKMCLGRGVFVHCSLWMLICRVQGMVFNRHYYNWVMVLFCRATRTETSARIDLKGLILSAAIEYKTELG
ncbi:hypothetical protein BDV93DRAFT_167936 [Ceratobasidium sp. AG-I]|nr:hypothetical protein BDV93DRAFT_167936 [Ceratobasidium sp. AG-I]